MSKNNIRNLSKNFNIDTDLQDLAKASLVQGQIKSNSYKLVWPNISISLQDHSLPKNSSHEPDEKDN